MWAIKHLKCLYFLFFIYTGFFLGSPTISYFHWRIMFGELTSLCSILQICSWGLQCFILASFWFQHERPFIMLTSPYASFSSVVPYCSSTSVNHWKPAISIIEWVISECQIVHLTIRFYLDDNRKTLFLYPFYIQNFLLYDKIFRLMLDIAVF